MSNKLNYKTGSTLLPRKQTCEYGGVHTKVEVMNVNYGPKTAEWPKGLPCTDRYGWRRHQCACCDRILQWDKVPVEDEGEQSDQEIEYF